MEFESLEQQLKLPFQKEIAQITGRVFCFQLITSSRDGSSDFTVLFLFPCLHVIM